MINQLTYRLLPHLPPPPTELVEQINFELRPEVNDIGAMGNRQLIGWNGNYTGSATRNIRRQFNKEYLEWVAKNITTNFQNASLMYCWGDPSRPSTGAHTDFTRDYVLMYNLSVGGPNATLTFWREKGQELVRDRGYEVGEFNRLEFIDSVKGPADVWYLANARILHSTEDVDSLRLNLQVSFDTTVPEEIL